MASGPQIDKRVVIIGAGFGGISLAKQLDPYVHVTLIEKQERFFHNIASLRAAVDPSWLAKIFIPYDRLLRNGRVIHDTVIEVSPKAVILARGKTLSFDYLVLATGSSYPFPAKTAYDDVSRSMKDMRQVGKRIRQAKSILLIGGGPVGIEFAGEIASAYPGKRVTLMNGAPDLMVQYNPRLGQRLVAELTCLGVQLVLGENLPQMPAQTNAVGPNGPRAMQTFVTDKGTKINADLYFTCFGAKPNSDYLAQSLAKCRDERGRVKVNTYLQVKGCKNIFAIGDLTDINEAKMAFTAGSHADSVSANIRRLAGSNNKGALKEYVPHPSNIMIVPVGPSGGAGQLPLLGGIVVGRFLTRMLKGRSLMVERYWKTLNATYPISNDHGVTK